MRIASKTILGLSSFIVAVLATIALKRHMREIRARPAMYACQAFQLAEEEARHLNHNYIGTEHLLLGLLRDNEGIAAQVLHSAGVEADQVRAKVEAIVGRGKHLAVGEIGLTGRVKKVMQLAIEEAQHFDHRYLGTEHLLLGLIREGEGLAVGVLESLGVDLKKLRMQTIKLLVANS
jgi:ATP-dependent Clp protease ATP-binding subunit ClpC